MNYRPFGRLNWQASALGFGCMRLPVVDGNPEAIDTPLAIEMIRSGIDGGINYIDTAYPYHGGKSEPLVGLALKDGYRQKVHLATKLPVWLVQSHSDFDKYLDEQLERLQTDHIDFYLLHALNKSRWAAIRQLEVESWIEKAISSGRIGQIGFSFHDDTPIFEQILHDYDGWAFCQIQYNYMDIEEQAGVKGLKLAAEKGLAVVVMEPLLGGKLAAPPQAVQSIFDQSAVNRSAVHWALQWLWDQPEVSVVLSGMSDLSQVQDNLAAANSSSVGLLTGDEHSLVDQVREKFRALIPIPCTKCRYCMPCPNGVDIPYNFEVFNKGAMMDMWGSARFRYSQIPAVEKASECIACMECEEKCPQKIHISDWMVRVHEVLGEQKPFAA
jgi:predicted aldo/keto reductase-like oxidoreductase